MTRTWQHWIDGAASPSSSGETYERVHPATREVVGTFASGTVEDVDRAVAAARRAFDAGPWTRSSGAERAAVLHRLAEILRTKADAYARLESDHVGIPYGQVSWLNWYCADVVDFYAGAARTRFGRSLWTAPSGLGFTSPEPVGVVAAITPWNFPLVLTIWKVAAALAAGCTIVVKPAPQAPATVLELAADLTEAGLPAGVCNVLTGPGALLGEALVAHPGVDKIAFTGSTATGRRVMEAASGTLKRISLELGGKSPLIVLPDADVEAASDAALECFFNSGQQCNVPSRLVVAGGATDVVDAVVEKARAKRLGADDDADLGPLVDDRQFATVDGYLGLAEREGARVATGGRAAIADLGLDGPFVPPTVLTGVDLGSALVREEIFGPVLVVQEARDLADAVRYANGGDFGLAAGIYTADLDAALVAAKELRAGTVWVNVWNKTYPELPTGGFGASGMGRELGLEGLDAYLETKTVLVQPSGRDR